MRNKSPTSQKSNSLPLEIWQHIFLLACTDGGRTGHALTLVSKFFHYGSQLVRFHSLAFTSLRQVEGFLAFAERTTTMQAKKPKVHHLLLSFSGSSSHEASPEFGRADDIYGANPPVPDVWFRARQAREQEKAAWDKRFAVVLSALFDLVGPHLETFALLQSDAFALPPLRYRLPHLRELTLLVGITVILNEDEALPGANPGGSAPSTSSAAPSSRSHAPLPTSSPSASAPIPSASPSPPEFGIGFEGPPSHDGVRPTPATRSPGHVAEVDGEHTAGARFPALERLHIICGRHRDWTLRDALAHLPRLAPSLACLRISNATYTHGSHGCVVAFLRAALDFDGSLAKNAIPSSDLEHFAAGHDVGEGRDHHGALAGTRGGVMLHLRRVMVHSIPPPPNAQCATSHKGYRALSDAMTELLAACELNHIHLQWRESERAKHQVWEETCRAQWVDMIESGSRSLKSPESEMKV